MGTYLNPGSGRYEIVLRGEIYVDKTRLISYLNAVVSTPQRFISVSRPRRFGKTMAADMICAYYDRSVDSRMLFEDKKIAGITGWDQYLNHFNVLRVVMTDFMRKSSTAEDIRKRLEKYLLLELKNEYPGVFYLDDTDLIQSMTDVYTATGIPFVVVIDEWDAIFRTWTDRGEDHRKYLDFLRDWLKDQEYVALAYMTGILPIKKYGVHSALNMFDEYSMISPMQLAPYTGFLEGEVRELCSRFCMEFSQIESWYDGYRLTDTIPVEKRHLVQNGRHPEHIYAVYSPFSVVNAMRSGFIQNYWNQTETFEALKVYIDRNYDGLKEQVAIMMEGGRVPVDITTYQNDMTTFHNKDDILTLLIHLGYLGYDGETGEAFIPNKEVLNVFHASTKSREWSASFRALEESQALLDATWNMDADKVADMLETFHEQAGTDGYHSEAAFSYAVQLAYYSAKNYYLKILELATGKGYADLVYLPGPDSPDKPALLIELKYQESAETAIAQIHRQNYPSVLEPYRGRMLLVAVSYKREVKSTSPEFKHHACVIEKA